MVPEAAVPEVTLDTVQLKATSVGLDIVGAFHPCEDDGVPEGIATLILLGPAGPGMWSAFAASQEYADNQAHPMDRWSERVISELARELEGEALFPFSGPPWQPFQKWALRGENAVGSPVAMQVSRTRGLWVSYRGALGLRHSIEVPSQAPGSPCAGCHAPCLTACPVSAFQNGVYDVPSCVSHVTSTVGFKCRSGCRVRFACPHSAEVELPPEQRAFHIDAFLRSNGGVP